MSRVVIAAVVMLTAPGAMALSFGTECTDPCAKERLVRTSFVVCKVEIGNDPSADEQLVVQDVHYVVRHAAGDETIAASNVPQTIEAGQTKRFLVAVTAEAADASPLRMVAIGRGVVRYPDGSQAPFSEGFADAVTLVDRSTCACTDNGGCR